MQHHKVVIATVAMGSLSSSVASISTIATVTATDTTCHCSSPHCHRNAEFNCSSLTADEPARHTDTTAAALTTSTVNNNNNKKDRATSSTGLLYSVDDNPPWHLSLLLGFQVQNL